MYLKITHGAHALRLSSPDGEPKRLFVKPGDVVLMREDVAACFLGQRPDCAEIIERPLSFVEERTIWLGIGRYLAHAAHDLARVVGPTYLLRCATWQSVTAAFDQAFLVGRVDELRAACAALQAYLRRHGVVIPPAVLSEEDLA